MINIVLGQTFDLCLIFRPILRRRFHQDWVLQVKYLPDLKCFASCSPGEKVSLVISSLKRINDTQ